MDFFIILFAFLTVIYIASEMESSLQKGKHSEDKGPKVCPPHPWRPRRTGDPAGSHYLICDKCYQEPFLVGRDTPPK